MYPWFDAMVWQTSDDERQYWSDHVRARRRDYRDHRRLALEMWDACYFSASTVPAWAHQMFEIAAHYLAQGAPFWTMRDIITDFSYMLDHQPIECLWTIQRSGTGILGDTDARRDYSLSQDKVHIFTRRMNEPAGSDDTETFFIPDCFDPRATLVPVTPRRAIEIINEWMDKA